MPIRIRTSLHRPKRYPSVEGSLPRPLRALTGVPLPPPCKAGELFSPEENSSSPPRHWRRQALREGLLATLLTTFLTSAVLASPESFRQSPATTWRQLSLPALANGQQPFLGAWTDCP